MSDLINKLFSDQQAPQSIGEYPLSGYGKSDPINKVLPDQQAPQSIGEYVLTGYGRGDRDHCRQGDSLRDAFARRSRPRGNSLIKAGQYLFLLLAIVCLGYYVLNDARALIFQTYESWRFDRIMNVQRDRAQSYPPAMAGRGSAPPRHHCPRAAWLEEWKYPR